MVKLLFYKGRKEDNPQSQLFDWIICFFTRSKYSHVEFVESEYPNGVCKTWSASPRDYSVRPTYINSLSGSWDVMEIPGDISRGIEWFSEHEGAKYNWIGLISVYIRIKLFKLKGTYFCSEAVGEALGLPSTWTLSPESLYRLSHELN